MGYLHGYTPSEQERLVRQARFLENKIFESLDLSESQRLLEIGCGTGAECELILKRYPEVFVTAIDISAQQLEKAGAYLRDRPELTGRYELRLADASDLSSLSGQSFDSAFLCWVLEHVSDPVQILSEARRVLSPGGKIFITEVFNHTLRCEPRIPALDRYWAAYNQFQADLGGDPGVGVKLGRHLHQSGYRSIQVWPKMFLFDQRDPAARAGMMEYWLDLMLSGSPQLLQAGRLTQPDVDALKTEWSAQTAHPETIFYYSFMQSIAAK
jgi:ubiquinone/menaquinone biosynthesis C-methylase UbiE